jgi:flagellar motor switch protein FliN/FliY
MNGEMSQSDSNLRKDYFEGWAEGACQVLGQISKSAFAFSELTSQQVEGQLKELVESGVWLSFEAGSKLKGQQAVLISPNDAVRLAQMLMTEPADASRPFSAEYADALGELFRQIATAAAHTFASRSGRDVQFQFAGMERPGWPIADQAGFKLTSEKAGDLQISIALSPELGESLQQTGEESHEPQMQVVLSPDPPLQERNIDLLMDVDLEVALRFGAREMPLREILELNTGAVVELDRKIQEPVELLLSGKVVARGEVVVMDGNYALRVTEIITPMERVASLPRA